MGGTQARNMDPYNVTTWERPISDEALVEHFYPPSFPITPIVTVETVRACRDSWQKIKTMEIDGTSGTVYFYTQFYMRLLERAEEFNRVFGPDVKKRGNVLAIVMEFMTSLDPSNRVAMEAQIRAVGEVHTFKGIRPWMYSVYVETLITTIALTLGDAAPEELMGRWAHLCSLTLRHMLPAAVKGRVIKTEKALNILAHEVDEDEVRNYGELKSAKSGGGGTTGRNSNYDYGTATGRSQHSLGGDANSMAGGGAT